MIDIYGAAGVLTLCMLLVLTFALGIGAGLTIAFRHADSLMRGGKRDA